MTFIDKIRARAVAARSENIDSWVAVPNDDVLALCNMAEATPAPAPLVLRSDENFSYGVENDTVAFVQDPVSASTFRRYVMNNGRWIRTGL